MTNCQKIIVGVKGITQSILHINRAKEPEIKRRLEICRECSEATKNLSKAFEKNKGLTTKSRCQVCGCFIWLKTSLRSESCPLGKW